MLAHCPGYPLWCPGPNLSEHLPVEYRKDGVSIGDIGLIRDGLFDFVFNFLRPANHPINGRGNFTPDGFVPCAWSGDMVQNRLGRGTQFKTLSVESINVPQHTEFPSSFSFQIRTSPSAICAMPRGALTTKMLDLGEVEEFITTHALEWYQYIGGRRKLQNGELYAITGTTKSDSWGLYVVDDIPQADGQIVTFGKLPGGPPRYYWSGERISGTVKHRDFEDPFFEEPNQAVFVTGFRIFLGRQYLNLFGPPKGVRIANIQDHRPGERGSTWIPFSRTAGMGQQSTREENVPGSTHPSRIDQVTRSPASNSLRTTEFASTAAGQTERRSQGQGSQSAVGKMEPCSSQVGIKDCEAKTVDPSWTLVKAFDPATEIQEHLLAVFPQAAVVIIHDHQWLSVLHPNDLTPPSTHDLWNRIKLRYTPFLKDGVAVLRPKDIGNHGEIEDGSCAELNKPFFEVNARICPEFACLTPPPSRRQTEDTPAALNQCQVLSY
ncbi:hypothetical protein C8R43DRAFT_969592 [Mycena crocata]|nr:hypothetical protein C8R43DRAFT_969592 [Mycena crocata]